MREIERDTHIGLVTGAISDDGLPREAAHGQEEIQVLPSAAVGCPRGWKHCRVAVGKAVLGLVCAPGCWTFRCC